MKEKLNKILEKVKRFFNRAWSIFLARLQLVTGLLVAGLSGADWGPIVGAATSVGVSKTQMLVLGGIVAFQGLLAELARRQGTKTIETGQLIPNNVEVKKVK